MSIKTTRKGGMQYAQGEKRTSKKKTLAFHLHRQLEYGDY